MRGDVEVLAARGLVRLQDLVVREAVGGGVEVAEEIGGAEFAGVCDCVGADVVGFEELGAQGVG